jgi:hypothetical protein
MISEWDVDIADTDKVRPPFYAFYFVFKTVEYRFWCSLLSGTSR